jgi:SAM-dependent methyltransferase
MQRVLEAEWLDSLSPHDARAQRSRADLRRVNFLMGNARHIARALSGPILRIADLGAGDGNLMLRVARRLRQPGVEVTLVDRAPCAKPSEFERVGWRARIASEDALEFLRRPGPRFDAIVCNLFLHHFGPAALRRLLAAAAQRTALLVACEPRRSRAALQACRLLGLLGCNEVTRHDAAVSVRAGFLDGELSSSWPQQPGWQLSERPARPFGHLFSARRDAAL